MLRNWFRKIPSFDDKPQKPVVSSLNIHKSENLFISTENYHLEAFVYDYRRLVVSFEPFNPNATADGYRMGWGSPLFRSQCVSHLCIKPKVSDWYRGPDLLTAFAELKAGGFFQAFETVVTYGGSMGGYAALAFADVVGAKFVFSLNPQSTLDKTKVPWETRFHQGWHQDWSSAYAEAYQGIENVEKAYIAVDMREELDRKHVDRITGSNVQILNMPYVGHMMPLHFQQAGILRSTLSQIMDGNLNLSDYRSKARARRNLSAYYSTLLSRPRVQGSEKFRNIVEDHKGRRTGHYTN